MKSKINYILIQNLIILLENNKIIKQGFTLQVFGSVEGYGDDKASSRFAWSLMNYIVHCLSSHYHHYPFCSSPQKKYYIILCLQTMLCFC